MTDVFLSYSRDDRSLAEVLARHLEGEGWSVWWDRAIPAGKTFDRIIEEALTDARCVVVLWSATSVASRWVRAEAEEGAKRSALLPVFIEETEAPLAFRQIQTADLVGWDKSAEDPSFRQLVQDIYRILEGDVLEPTVQQGLDPTVKSPAKKTPTHASPGSTLPGRVTIPGYRVMGRLGEGGMGEVYEAEQLEPVRRRVALKVIKWGMDTKEVLGRFESERQALALMDHPTIASVFEAGATARGRPYFAMELVQGEPITSYCDRHRLRTRERLELFVKVCEGVQHAHQKGILHRDLKPSNVLVKLQDGVPTPKIIDFGLAKATAQRLAERTVFTEHGQLIGTPAYMSPEQAEMTGLDVDTRTDIYSLGVLLYELLVGALPFDAKELHEAGFDEIRRRIREDQPARPSTRLSGLGGDSDVAATNRGSDAPALAKRLRGDLDWIVMKALEKDRTRRYETATALGLDIERHLGDEPVRAGPPSTAYRLTKFVRRHKVGVVAGSLVALALFAGIAGTTTGLIRARQAEAEATAEAQRANREAEAAEQVSDFLVELFEVSDPGEARGEEITAREILDQGTERVREELADQPLIRARMLHTIGTVHHKLGLFEDSAPLLEEALEAREDLLGPSHPDVAQSLSDLGVLYFDQGRYEEAEPLMRRALEIREHALGPDHQDVADSLNNLAVLYHMQSKLDRAEPLYLRALEARENATGPGHPDAAHSLNNLAVLYAVQERYEEADRFLRQALAIHEKTLGPDHPDVAASLNNLGGINRDLGNYAEAESLYLRALEIRETALGPDHLDVAYPLHGLGNVYRDLERFGEAEPLYKRALALREASLQPDHPNLIEVSRDYATLLRATGREETAATLEERLPAQAGTD